VHILAKELDVKSSAIIKKCRDEGLDVKNHMSVISAGLAATIKEWFSEGENVTTIETAKKVDLKKVRIKKKKKAPAKPKKAKAEPEAPAEAPAEAPPEVPAEAPPEVPAEIPQPPAEAEKPTEPAPPEPEPIKPMGPMLEKPAPAQLAGPQLVRIEAPEPVVKPRPRTRLRRDGKVTEPLMYVPEEKEQEVIGVEVKRPPRRSKEKGHPRQEEAEGEGRRKVKLRKLRQADIEERRARLEAARGRGLRLRPARKIAARSRPEMAIPAKVKKAYITEPITMKNLSAVLGVKSGDIFSKLMQHGTPAIANQPISPDAAELIALEFNTELVVERAKTITERIRAEFEQIPRNNLKRRPVVATMLGHVDHGKTSLLDKIRESRVTDSEAGGITQHIGAYQVALGERKITFLDTPGHEAFTAMRARGANMTDVAVLVVAADDGVMPQTVEAINHAKAAQVAILVALNKVDLGNPDFNRIYSQLAEHGLTPSEWGGDTEIVKTSAVTGEGIDDLLEHLDYVAELLDLKADDTIPATGWVVEARLSPTQGPVATVLVAEGRLAKGDIVLAGGTFGRVKTLQDYTGRSIREAVSAMPVEITGLNDVPLAGDRFYRLDDLNRAKTAAEQQCSRMRELALSRRDQVTLDNLFTRMADGGTKEINIVIRADVQGSVDVLTKYLTDLSTDEVKVKVLHAAPGGITEGDVLLAEASNAVIIGFNVVAEDQAARMADHRRVDIRLYDVIYRVSEDVQKSMAGLLEPEEKEKPLGKAVVRNTFKVSKVGTVAGCYVTDGAVTNNARVRLIRDNVVVKSGLAVDSLKHFKEDVKQIKTGFECGIKLARFDDVKIDDVLEFFEIVKVARAL
jgi:translation initiation factor IF-2